MAGAATGAGAGAGAGAGLAGAATGAGAGAGAEAGAVLGAAGVVASDLGTFWAKAAETTRVASTAASNLFISISLGKWDYKKIALQFRRTGA